MTRDEYFDAVYQLVKNNEDGSKGLKASYLGLLLSRSIPQSHSEFGYATLKGLLSDMQVRGFLKLGGEGPAQALTVWTETRSPQAATAATLVKPTYMRTEVWSAFVRPFPQGRRFLNRITGDVRMGLEKAPTPPDDWAEILPIPEEAQKSWLRDFLDHSELANDGHLRELLGDQHWFVKVPSALRKHQTSLYGTWNRIRTEHVVQIAYDWCGKNNVVWSLVAQEKAQKDRPSAAKDNSAVSPPAVLESAREQMLAALARMPTSELLAIPIPGKYFISEISN